MKGLSVVVTFLLLVGAERLASHLREKALSPAHARSSLPVRYAAGAPAVHQNPHLNFRSHVEAL